MFARYCVNNILKPIKLFAKYKRCENNRFGLTKENYRIEYKKYLRYLKAGCGPKDFSKQIDEFFTRSFDNLKESESLIENQYSPTVVCVVKDELERMKLFYNHYRRLGIKKFVVLDNDSSDGTCEYLLNQKDTHVYSVKEPFQTQKKESWIEKLLALEGYNKWYIVVDSDELLDYPGSEEHGIEKFIAYLSNHGYSRAFGLMLDMYSDKQLFSVDCNALDIPKELCYFDADSYFFVGGYEKNFNKKSFRIMGGPRYRMCGSPILQSKQSVFYFTPDVLYRHCHFLYPEIEREEAPICFVLRHYKFLKTDENVYKHRIDDGTYHNGSSEYKQMFKEIERGKNTFYYSKSIRFDNSYSLLTIPFLNEIDW